MNKHKNWRLFLWAIKHLKIDAKHDDIIYKKCIRNSICLWLMNLSGVTPADIQEMLFEIKNELKNRVGEA